DTALDRRLRSAPAAGVDVHVLLIPEGEANKTLATVEDLLTRFLEHGADRTTSVVALGGGVVGDIAGFAAAVYQRGVPFVQLPTTLLAQIDSSVGGKTGVNHALGKNLIGAFHQPSLVVIDTETLRTLPPREMQSGLYEAIKYGVIRDRQMFDRIARKMDALRGFDDAELVYLIA